MRAAMIDRILELHYQGLPERQICRTVGVQRLSVRRVLLRWCPPPERQLTFEQLPRVRWWKQRAGL
jgi:hypothetical protein